MKFKLKNFVDLKNDMKCFVEKHYEDNLELILNDYREFKIQNLDFFKYKNERIKNAIYKDLSIEIEFVNSKCQINNKNYKDGDILNIVVKKSNILLNLLSVKKEIYFESEKLHYAYSPLLEYWNISVLIEDDFYNRATLINNNGFYQIHLVKENVDGSTYKCILTEEHIFDLEYFSHKKETIGKRVENFYMDNKIPKLR